ncbi:MAG: TetR/AcrR family transcriptional regulator [Trueperaceae bacterium]|nr:TetR/AcrR family transcriptional regulator [Trueperaceae bacterium]
MTEDTISPARERVLDSAEKLFGERGYASVTMRDIANDLGMKQASLYYHAPGGKEALFTQVLERSLTRHQEGLERTLASARPDIRTQLHVAADWHLSQPPMNFIRMLRSDMSALPPDEAKRLSDIAYRAMITPLASIFSAAQSRNEIRSTYPDVLAGSFLATLDGIAFVRDTRETVHTPDQMAQEIIRVFLEGLYRAAS